jgi:hypothetical protein
MKQCFQERDSHPIRKSSIRFSIWSKLLRAMKLSQSGIYSHVSKLTPRWKNRSFQTTILMKSSKSKKISPTYTEYCTACKSFNLLSMSINRKSHASLCSTSRKTHLRMSKIKSLKQIITNRTSLHLTKWIVIVQNQEIIRMKPNCQDKTHRKSQTTGAKRT